MVTTRRPTPHGGRAALSLQRLRAEHGPAVLRFERQNRAWFAASVTDRGAAWFEGFAKHLDALLLEQLDGQAGLLPDGPADPSELGGGSGPRFRRALDD